MFLRLVYGWILISAAASSAGWLLSWFGALHGPGYLLAGAVFTVAVFLAGRPLPLLLPPSGWRAGWARLWRRFRRPAPLLFLALLGLSGLGGVLYEPIHGDSQSYRTPRVLHWLWENQWHWIHTGDVRMNVVAPGCEWLWAPGFFFLPGQRWLFLYNWVSLLLLPGLLFMFFRELGVARRTAWWWMWVLPAAYGYALQAGGISTDAYATVYALAAAVFALRGWKHRRARELLLSMIAAGLMTGAKQTNLLLIPLWFLPFALSWRLLLKHPVLAGGAAALAIGASCVPISVLNTKYAGNWQGFTDTRTFVPQSPLYGVLGNLLALPAQNLLPPVFPWADRWNAAMEAFRKTPFGAKFDGFEDFGHLYRMPSDMTGGLGLALCVLAGWSLMLSKRPPRRSPGPEEAWDRRLTGWAFRWGPWLLLIVFMAKVGTATNARYLAPMYPFLLLPVLLRSGPACRRPSWQVLACGASVVTSLLLISSRQRPLFPVQTLCGLAQQAWPELRAVQKVRNAYAYFQEHGVLMHQLAAALPPDVRAAGYATEVGFLESALWLPYGTRRVWRFTGQDSRDAILSKGVRYVVVEETVFETAGVAGIDGWLARYQAKVLASWPLRRLGPEARVETVYLVALE